MLCVFRDLPINSCIEFHSCMAVPNLFNQPPRINVIFIFCVLQSSDEFPRISHRVLRGNLGRPTTNAPWVITVSVCIRGWGPWTQRAAPSRTRPSPGPRWRTQKHLSTSNKAASPTMHRPTVQSWGASLAHQALWALMLTVSARCCYKVILRGRGNDLSNEFPFNKNCADIQFGFEIKVSVAKCRVSVLRVLGLVKPFKYYWWRLAIQTQHWSQGSE